MSIRVGDYLYVRETGEHSSHFVVKVKSIDDTRAFCKDVSTGHLTGIYDVLSFTGNIDADIELIANLGDKPKVKSIDGLPTHDVVGKISSLEGYRPIWFFYKPSKEVLTSYKDAFAHLRDILKKFSVDQYLEEINFEVHNSDSIKASKDTIAMYIKDLSRVRIISEQVSDLETSKVDLEVFTKALTHEFAHHLYVKIRKNTMLMSAWAEAFSDISKCALASNSLKRLVEDFLVSGNTFSSFMKTLDNENDDYTTGLSDRQLFKKYSSYAARLYKLSVKDLDNLSRQGKFDVLEKVLLKDIQPFAVRVVASDVISKYGSKSLTEYFAEVFSAYFTGVVLSKNLSSLIKKTLDIINQNSKKKEDEE